jgi:hypothetical protein
MVTIPIGPLVTLVNGHWDGDPHECCCGVWVKGEWMGQTNRNRDEEGRGEIPSESITD